MGGRRRHNRYLLTEALHATLRVREEVDVESWNGTEIVVLGTAPSPSSDDPTVELDGASTRHLRVKVQESKPIVAPDGSLRHRLRLVVQPGAGNGNAMNNMEKPGHDGDAFGMLVWTLPVRLLDVSRSGCLVEVGCHLNIGANGQLQLEMDGVLHVDDVRVCRCQLRQGARPVHLAGMELLRTRRLSRRSLRPAMRRIIGDRWGPVVDAFREPASLDGSAQAGTNRKRDVGRAPPPPGTPAPRSVRRVSRGVRPGNS